MVKAQNNAEMPKTGKAPSPKFFSDMPESEKVGRFFQRNSGLENEINQQQIITFKNNDSYLNK